MSTSLSPHPDVAVLPSLPPSPSLLDEVFSHPRPWSVRLEDFDWQRSRRSSPGSVGSHPKGKGRQTIDEVEEEDEDAEHRMSPHEAYPPMNDEAAETQRVEEVRARPPIPSQISRTPASLLFERHSHIHPERLPSTFHQRTDVLFFFFGDKQTLKRWELAERKRRKSIRESVHYTSPPSLLSSVTRTASIVLSGRTSIGTSVGPGNTRTFKSHESVDVAREGYNVPLDDIDHTHASRDVAVHSPSPERNTSLDASTRTRTSENPNVGGAGRLPGSWT